MKRAEPLDKLVGRTLSSLALGADGVELYFHDTALRVEGHPSIARHGEELRFPGDAARRALFTTVGARVASIELDDARTLTLTWSDGTCFRFRLREPRSSATAERRFVILPRADCPDVERTAGGRHAVDYVIADGPDDSFRVEAWLDDRLFLEIEEAEDSGAHALWIHAREDGEPWALTTDELSALVATALARLGPKRG